MNPNLGDRFVADRRISLFTISNQFGAGQIWFKMKSSMCRYADDLHAPNIAKILLTTGLTVMQAQYTAKGEESLVKGGTWMGCFSWQECKMATMGRCVDYGTLGGTGVATGLLCIVAGVSAGMGLICMGKEGHVKKKKKKIEAEWNTCIAGMVSFISSFLGVMCFIMISKVYFNQFKELQYYPYPYVSVGSYMGSFACFLFLIAAFCGFRRQSYIQEKDDDEKHSKHHKHHDDDDGGDDGGDGGSDDGGGDEKKKKKKKHKH